MEEEDLSNLPVKQLRAILTNRGVDFYDCIEKADLVNKIRSTAHLQNNKVRSLTTEKNVKVGSLLCTIVQNTTEPDLVVVLSHGYGANGKDLVPIAQVIMETPELKNKPMKFIFPDAPLTLENGGLAWYPIDLQSLITRAMQGQLLQIANETPPGLTDAREKLSEMINVLKSQHNLPWNKFVFAGFSQGAILSIDLCFHIEEPIGALAIFSGSLVCSAEWQQLLSQRKPGTKVLQSHGTQDNIIAYQMGLLLNQCLSKGNCLEVEFVRFDGGHSIPPQALKKFSQLLVKL